MKIIIMDNTAMKGSMRKADIWVAEEKWRNIL